MTQLVYFDRLTMIHRSVDFLPELCKLCELGTILCKLGVEHGGIAVDVQMWIQDVEVAIRRSGAAVAHQHT